MADPRPSGKQQQGGEDDTDAKSKRVHESDVAPYPYTMTLAMHAADDDTRASEKEALELDATNEAPARTRWPYYFAQPAWLSAYRRWTSTYNRFADVAIDDPDDLAAVDAVIRTTHLPVLQQKFLDALMPQNRPLLRAWMHMFGVNLGLVGRGRNVQLIKAWMQSSAAIIGVLRMHPAAHTLTDLLSLLPLVEQGMRDGQIESERDETTEWEFYKRMFMPGPARVAVPLPVGLVLFEGRGTQASTDRVMHDRVRRTPFSASWHPNVAMQFITDDGNMFVHKIMSDGILGIDVQCTRREKWEKPAYWNECEVIVQPLVSFHRVHDALVLLDSRPLDHTHAPERTRNAHWVHVVFTHAFLGDVCPCEAQKEASEATSSSSASASHAQPDAKRQRLAGRLHLD